jgi:hypothetical protein
MSRRCINWAAGKGFLIKSIVIGLLCLFLCVVLIRVVTVFGFAQESRVTEPNFRRLTIGMTRAEVFAILGRPGDYSKWYAAPSEYDLEVASAIGTFGEGGQLEAWAGNGGSAGVKFDESGRVMSAGWWTLHEQDQGLLGNFRVRATRLWHKLISG